jgi:integrase
LWLSRNGTPQTPGGMNKQICKRTRDAFGIAICPHLFRDCCATSLAIHEPKVVNIAASILGNSIDTCQRYYNLAQTLEAGRALDSVIDRLRSR